MNLFSKKIKSIEMRNLLYILSFFSLIAIGCNKSNADKVMKEAPMLKKEAWRATAPSPAPARSIELGISTSFELDNGLKVIVVENHKLPRVSYQLSLDHDAIVEGDQAGYVTIAGQLMKTGTTTKSKADIDEAVDFIGANLSTSGSGVFASTLTKHQDKLLSLMTDILFNPSFNADEFEKIKKQTISGIASSKTDPNAMAGNVATILNNGKGHPYGEVQTEETVKSITIDKCKEYYNTYFKPNNAYLVVVGDISPAVAKANVEKYFGNWKKGKIPTVNYKKPSAPGERKVAVVNKDGAVQSVIRITYPVDLKLADDDLIAARVMNSILGGGIFSGRLMQNLREDKAYTYGARSSLRADRLVGNFNASASVRNEVTDSSVHEFLFELDRMITEGFAEEDIQLTKNSLAGSFARSLESPQTIARFALNKSRYNLPDDYYNTYLSKLDAITEADVKRVAKKYIRPDNAYVIVVGSKDDIADKLLRFDADGVIDYYDAFGNEVKYDDAELPSDITAATVLEDYIAAIGGKDKVMTVKNMTTIGAAEMMGQKLSVESFVVNNAKVRQKFIMAGNVMNDMIYDGTKVSTNGIVATSGKEMDQAKESAMIFPQLGFTSNGYKSELKGTQPVDGNPAYKIVVTKPSGDKMTQLYDVKSSLLVEEIRSEMGPGDQAMTITTGYADYKEVNGIMIPHTVTVTGMAPMPLTMTMEKVMINSTLGDDLFMIK